MTNDDGRVQVEVDDGNVMLAMAMSLNIDARDDDCDGKCLQM